ncbi:hypothetical protein CRG98_010632 [Punica granatum]|uniref:Uncharacterized protein n=1 Tax=Punica granatum TaxID=22663 RepID=A0A2I0KKA9_PUNGR|nr:hypothetical protein CRG98_010632 [Punica granatum]
MGTPDQGGVAKLYGPECAHVGARMRVTESRGLGVSHLPGGRVRRSHYLPVYDPKVEGQ